jgi:hypothetical protein
MTNQQYLSDLLKAFSNKDLDAADEAIVNLRVGILTGKEMPEVLHDKGYTDLIVDNGAPVILWTDHVFHVRHKEQVNE